MTQFMKLLLAGTITGMVTTAAIGTASAAGPENRITILYDAFGKDASMRKDWGFSALVEIAGKRILFDTGDDRDIFAAKRQKTLISPSWISSFYRIGTGITWRGWPMC